MGEPFKKFDHIVTVSAGTVVILNIIIWGMWALSYGLKLILRLWS